MVVGKIFIFLKFLKYPAKLVLRPIGLIPSKISNIIMLRFLKNICVFKNIVDLRVTQGGTIRPIVVKILNYFCYIVHNVCLKMLVLK